MIRKHLLFIALFLIFECLSAKAKEVKLFCYSFKGHPHGRNFIIDTEKKMVRDGGEIFKNDPEYQIISWSSEKILFTDPITPIRKVMGYTSYSIDRVSLDFSSIMWNKDNRLEQQFYGKCEFNQTKPQF